MNTAAMLLCVTLLTSWLLDVDAALLPQKADFSVFIFRRTPPLPNATLVVTYPPSLTAQPPVGVPVVTVGDQPMRLTVSEKDPVVGRQRTIRVTGQTKEDQFMTQTTGVLDFRTSKKNGTISFSGIQTTGAGIPPIEELAITGGTGMYQSADGFVKVFLVTNVGGNVILRWDIFVYKRGLLR